LESRPGLPVVVTPAPGLDREVSPPQGGRIDAPNRGPLRREGERKKSHLRSPLFARVPGSGCQFFRLSRVHARKDI